MGTPAGLYEVPGFRLTTVTGQNGLLVLQSSANRLPARQSGDHRNAVRDGIRVTLKFGGDGSGGRHAPAGSSLREGRA
jgi:hypothetical protein